MRNSFGRSSSNILKTTYPRDANGVAKNDVFPTSIDLYSREGCEGLGRFLATERSDPVAARPAAFERDTPKFFFLLITQWC